MDGAGKQGGEDLQVCEDSLERGQREQEELLSIRSEDDRCDLCVGRLEPGPTSRAGVDSKTCVDWTTSAAWMLLW